MAANVRPKSMTESPRYTPSAYQPCVLMSCFNREDSEFGAASDGGGEGEVEYARRAVNGCLLLMLLLPEAPIPRGERERVACPAENGSTGAVRGRNMRKIGIRKSRAGSIASALDVSREFFSEESQVVACRSGLREQGQLKRTAAWQLMRSCAEHHMNSKEQSDIGSRSTRC